jgi:hypothetical protein
MRISAPNKLLYILVEYSADFDFNVCFCCKFNNNHIDLARSVISNNI